MKVRVLAENYFLISKGEVFEVKEVLPSQYKCFNPNNKRADFLFDKEDCEVVEEDSFFGVPLHTSNYDNIINKLTKHINVTASKCCDNPQIIENHALFSTFHVCKNCKKETNSRGVPL
jgi:hypothetical protein